MMLPGNLRHLLSIMNNAGQIGGNAMNFQIVMQQHYACVRLAIYVLCFCFAGVFLASCDTKHSLPSGKQQQAPASENMEEMSVSARKSGVNLDDFNNCPMMGNAVPARVKELNLLKNRYYAPDDAEINRSITLERLLAPGDDHERWATTDAAEIIGYVYDVKPGGVETCNCKTKDIDKRDVHIELITDPMNDGAAQRLVVEITPRWRHLMAQKGIDWTTRAVRDAYLGRWVKVRGWVLFDGEHDDEAENTNPGRERNWRGSAWEVHPVTSMEVTMRPTRKKKPA